MGKLGKNRKNLKLSRGFEPSTSLKTNFGVPFDDPYLFKLENWSDQEIGGLLLVLSLLVLCGSLMLMTKILSSLLKGKFY